MRKIWWIVFFGFFSLLLSSCKEESDPIVIPPGAQIQFSTTDFLYYSDDKYNIFLRQPTEVNGELETILDLTPDADSILDAEKIHQVISPKDIDLSGPYILQVNMEYHSLVLYDFIFDPDSIAKPSLLSTLAYNALANNPDKLISTYSASQILQVKRYIEEVAEQRMTQFQVSWELNPKLVYNFLKNGLEADPVFLDLLKTVGAEYNYDSDGNILSAPYPFGVPNNPPTLNTVTSTAPGIIVGKEQTTLEVTAEAEDIDGDLLFYIWTRDGEVVLTESQLYAWTPNSQEGGGDNYNLQVQVTDGGKILDVVWELIIQDFNRKPEVEGLCTALATEKVSWVCELTGIDPDDDPLVWSIKDTGTNVKPTLNGVAAPATVASDVATIIWTPNNDDAKSGSAVIEVRVDDGKNGFQIRNYNLTVVDVNSPPVLLGGGIVATNPTHTSPREWDYCLNADPLGGGEYTFDLVVQDPDNLDPATDPKDEISVTVSGSLLNALVEYPPTILADRKIFHYSWRPRHQAKSGSLVVLIGDDHNGIVPPQTFNLTAQDMNQVPCRNAGVNINIDTHSALPVANGSRRFVDGDGDPVLINSRNIDNKVLHHIQTCNGGYEPVVKKRGVGEADWLAGTYSTSGNFCVRNWVDAPYAGAIEFHRPGGHTSDVTIPAGTRVKVDEGTHNIRAIFETTTSVVIAADENSVIMPVEAVDRVAPVATLTLIDGAPLADPSIQVSNPNALDNELETVNFSRAAPFGGDVIIPSGTVLRTDIGLSAAVPSLEYLVIEDHVFEAAETSLNGVVTRRRPIRIPPGNVDVLLTGLADPAIVVSNPEEVRGAQDTVRYDYKANLDAPSNASFCFPVEGYDGARASANEINGVTGPLAAQLSVDNPGLFDLVGAITLTRSSGAGSLTVTAADHGFTTDNLKNYHLLADATFLPGETSKTFMVEKDLVRHPGPNQWYYNFCIRYRDYNYPPIFNSTTSATVDEGSANLGHLITVTDNVGNPNLVHDQEDLHTFTLANVGSVPVGDAMLCREPAVDIPNFANNCTPCTDLTGLTPFMSTKCYLRFKPEAADVAKTFLYRVTVDDNGSTYPSNSNVRSTIININVKEFNDAPFFTDDSWVPIAGPIGESETNPVDLGTFIENVETSFPLFVEDSDITFDFKIVDFEIDPLVYDIRTTSWVPAPTGISIDVKGFNPNPGGIGAKTEASLSWTPTDEEVKRLSSTEGFVLKIRTFDALSNASLRQDDFLYLKVFVKNTNNTPELGSIGSNNSLEIIADTYFMTEFDVSDADAFIPAGGAFQTDLTICKDNLGGFLTHPTLDPAPVPPVVDCHATAAKWPVEIMTYDASYPFNQNVGAPECRSGVGEVSLNEDLAVPKFTRISGPSVVDGRITFRYRMEWCPQRAQLGLFNVNLRLTDNGDVAVSGETKLSLSGSAPLELNVKAPVFFKSPRLDSGGVPEHHMVQASGGLSSLPFVYKTIVSNSKENALLYEIIDSPRDCALPNGVCIDGNGEITWVPELADLTDPGDPSTWHKIEIKVTDPTEGETDQVHFFLQVQSPLGPPVEMSPIISTQLPVSSSVSASEREDVNFSVTASDNNPDDVLWYRWFVDGKLISDEGDSFVYRPSATAGTEDPDGGGPLKAGQHVVRVEVDDGNSFDSFEWTVSVKNSILKPVPIFDVYSARGIASMTDIEWNHDLSLNTVVGSNDISYLLFAGAFRVGPTTHNYGWSLQFINGELQTSSYNFYENLSWPAGARTTNIAYLMLNATSFQFLLTPQESRNGPFSSTTNSVKLSGTYTSLDVPLRSGNVCSSSCARSHYTGAGRYGERAGAAYIKSGNHFVFASDDRSQLIWDRNATSASTFYTLPAGASVMDVAINTSGDRAYVTTQDLLGLTYRLLVFDISPILSTADPVLVADLNVYDGNASHVDSRPNMIVVDETNNHAYIQLSGTGGVLRLDDSGGVPGPVQMTYLSVDDIEPSLDDLPKSGQRMAIDVDKGILYGISRSGRQVYTIDLNAGDKLSVSATAQKFDSIHIFEGTNLILLIDRSNSQVFKAL